MVQLPFIAWALFLALLSPLASTVLAQEFTLLGGAIENPATRHRSYSWQLEYREPLGEHFAAALSYLNEGHLPNHHRDGHTLQLWARTSMLDQRLSLAAGAGPYYFFDTTAARAGASSSNDHGWKAMASIAASWQTESRWLFQLRANWVGFGGSIDTLSALAGIGYQLEPPRAPGPLPHEPLRRKKTTDNEITLFLGRTIVNGFSSEHSEAASIEYRRGLGRYVDWTVAWLYEGDNRLVRRDGVTSQLWGVRAFLDDRLALGAGAGAYLAIDRYHELSPARDADFLSGIVTLTGNYRFHPHWGTRISWNRIVTNYDRDTDVILAGIGYRF